MKLNTIVVYCLLNFLPGHQQFGFGGSSEPLYSSSDIGITLINYSNFTQTILKSDSAWMVEFYSSWCGHCIRFAPIFKDLGQTVSGWRSMMKLAAIDCAQDENVATCREYDIMGYPSLKFFPPNASKSDLGELRETMSKEIPLMQHDMAQYMEKIFSNSSFSDFWSQNHWPNFSPLTGTLESVWSESEATKMILIAEENGSPMGVFAMMELQTIMAKNSGVIVRRGHILENPSFDLLKSTHSSEPLVVLELEKNHDPTVIFKTQEIHGQTWPELRQVLANYAKNLPAVDSHATTKDRSPTKNKNPEAPEEQPIKIEAEIKRRRYTAYMSDLENAILYSLTHEIGSHNSIVGPPLDALREYLAVLVKHFPGRVDTMTFLHKLHTWALTHTDAIKGEDLIGEVNDLRATTGAFVDTPNGVWIGCRGSKPIYGGYPCSLWTLWHVLTVNQQAEETPPHRLLEAMVGYVKHFFGCQDCVRHFMQVAESLSRESVFDKKSSILWLWRAHNKANLRLSGDITDDKAFPKEVFPNREHCSDCYTNRLGSDLWSEFDRDKVVEFLSYLYGEENLSGRGLRVNIRGNGGHSQHEIAVYKEDEPVHRNEYVREENSFWGPMDFSLCFSIYLLSAIILLVVYFKFVAKKNICFGMIYNYLNSRGGGGATSNGFHNVV